VKFDGLKNGILLDAKSRYSQFIDKKTGTWHDWFTGQEGIIKQADRQIKAAQGVLIEWHFEEEVVRDLVKSLTKDEGLKGIKFVYTPLK